MALQPRLDRSTRRPQDPLRRPLPRLTTINQPPRPHTRSSDTLHRTDPWGLLGTDQTSIDVTAPRGRHGATGIRLHRSRSLDARDTTRHQGIPVTTVHRTLLDLAATARPSELERALAQSERLQIYDHAARTDVIARNNGHRGTHVLAQATMRKPRWTKNEWEAEFLDLIRKAGLPEPDTNDTFHVPDYGRCEPDYHWPQHRVIVETDGFETHGTRRAFRNDRAKDAALAAAGYHVLRFTRDDHPALAAKRLRAVLARRSAA